MTRRLVFVVGRRDVHSDRFSTLFESLGFPYSRVDWSGGSGSHSDIGEWSTSDQFRELLGATPTVVVSGPLDGPTAQLSGGEHRHIGISWATDVMVTAASTLEGLTNLRETLQTLDSVITDNYATENALIALGVPHDRIIRTPWGPDTSESSVKRDRAYWGIPEDRFVFLFPRSLSPHYQPVLFVDALTEVTSDDDQIHAVVVESGELAQDMRKECEDRGLMGRMTWLAPVKQEDFPALLQVADAVVVAPITDGTSVTVMQAMAEGTPVVSSLTNGSAEWIIDGVTGWSFAASDSSGLSGALRDLRRSDPERVRVITENARRLVSQRAGWPHSSGVIAGLIRKYLEI